jgi:hypothetical protein
MRSKAILALVWMAGGGSGQTPSQQSPLHLPAVLRAYQPVTAARLKNPESSNWLMIRRTYDGWGYSRSIRSRRKMSSSCGRFGCSRPARRGFTKLRRSSTMVC